MKDNTKDKLLTYIFLLIIIGILIINIITKDKNISYSERRYLEKLPSINYNDIMNGTFMTKFDSYSTDQFIYRDKFRKLKVNLELNTKGTYNGLFINDSYIIKEMDTLNNKSVTNVINKINYIKNNYLNNTNNTYYTIVPDKYYFIDNGISFDYDTLISTLNNNLDVKYINIIDDLNIDNYYKSDTHWKEETLIDISNKIRSNMNTFIDSNYSKRYILDFNGVYSSQIISDIYDGLYVLDSLTINNSIVYNYEDNTTSNVYNMNKKSSLDKYDIYLSGSTSLIKITNNISNNNKELVVFRDSYGSSLIPLLISCYKHIYVVDTRYISSKLLNNYIDFNNKDILFIYSTLLINDSFTLK